MKIKKILAIALAAAMVFALAACGKSGGDTPAPAGSGGQKARREQPLRQT